MTARRVHVATARPYDVTIGPGVLAGAAPFVGQLDSGKVAVLTDENVAPLYRERLGLERAPTCVVPAGEESKSFARLEELLDFLVEADLDRRAVLVALGGGVVGDLGGLAASLFMRGIDLVQCPTSLLAQVDSSVGGKTAVNLAGGKNLAGTFHQPRAVLADTATLATLADDEYRSGLGEVVKSALIGDPELLELLVHEAAVVLARDPARLGEIVERCVRVKAGVVARDERETGERKQLNLGHTFAHAIERVAGYGAVPHGVAVATGLALAVRASAETGVLDDDGLADRLGTLLEALGLPPDLATLRARYDVRLAPDELIGAMALDKKGAAGAPRFVLVEAVGRCLVDREVESAALARVLR